MEIYEKVKKEIADNIVCSNDLMCFIDNTASCSNAYNDECSLYENMLSECSKDEKLYKLFLTYSDAVNDTRFMYTKAALLCGMTVHAALTDIVKNPLQFIKKGDIKERSGSG